jgi:hypothetical protein
MYLMIEYKWMDGWMDCNCTAIGGGILWTFWSCSVSSPG